MVTKIKTILDGSIKVDTLKVNKLVVNFNIYVSLFQHLISHTTLFNFHHLSSLFENFSSVYSEHQEIRYNEP